MKRILLLAGLAAWGALVISSYRGARLAAASGQLEDPAVKVRLLKRASAAALPEPIAPYLLGKAYHDLGLRKLAAGEKAEPELKLSVASLKRSVRLNPYSAFSHFHLARALMDLDAVSGGVTEDPLDEYKRAARLSGFNSEVYFEVGKALLARWKDLSPENRTFARGILKSVMAVRDPAMARGIFEVWGMNVPDYELMRSILPEDAAIERAYADFLGRKSLPYGERLAVLVQSEARAFRNAAGEFERAETERSSGQHEKAVDSFWQCMKKLRGIRFYQEFAASKPIDPAAFRDLQRSCWLNLTLSSIDAGLDFRRIRSYLEQYLAMEDRVSELGPLEALMKERGFIDMPMTAGLDDPEKTGAALALFYKENRYQDIIQVGRLLEKSLVVVPADKQADYVKLLLVIGDSYQKMDYLYDAGDTYRKAAGIRPRDIGILVRLRQNAQRLNDEKALAEVDGRIRQVMTPREIVLGQTLLQIGSVFARRIILDGRPCVLGFRFSGIEAERPPLISIVFNGRVVREGFLTDPSLSIPVDTAVGENEVSLTSLNRGIALEQLTYQ